MRAITASEKFSSEKTGILGFTVVAKGENIGANYSTTESEAGEREIFNLAAANQTTAKPDAVTLLCSLPKGADGSASSMSDCWSGHSLD